MQGSGEPGPFFRIVRAFFPPVVRRLCTTPSKQLVPCRWMRIFPGVACPITHICRSWTRHAAVGKKSHGISSTIRLCKLYKLCKPHKGRKGIDASGIIEPRLRPEEGSGTSAMRRAPMKSPRAWRASSRSYLGEPLCFFILVHWLLPVDNSV